MTLLQIDPEAVRLLAAELDAAAGSADDAAGRTATALVLADLLDAVPEAVRDRADRWRTQADTLRRRADEVDAFRLGIDSLSVPGVVQVVELGDGTLAPSAAQADALILTLLELEAALGDLGDGALDEATARLLAERSEAVLEDLARALGMDPLSAAMYATTRGIDLLGDRLAELELLSPVVAGAMGIDDVRRRRDELAARFAEVFPEADRATFLAAIERGATTAEALAPWDPNPDRTRRHQEALERWASHGGSFQEAYDAGAIDAEDLTFLVPIHTRGSDFFLDPSEYEPQPYWYDTDVAYYWRFLDEEGVDASREWVEARVEQMPGISTVPEAVDDERSWTERIAGWAITVGTFALSAVEGCVGFVDALGPEAMATGGAIAGTILVYTSVSVSGGAVVLATCFLGGAAHVALTAATSD